MDLVDSANERERERELTCIGMNETIYTNTHSQTDEQVAAATAAGRDEMRCKKRERVSHTAY